MDSASYGPVVAGGAGVTAANVCAAGIIMSDSFESSTEVRHHFAAGAAAGTR